ncbi:hypothetical protein [Vibrio vulnificus YJ016]|uniref:Uncharacterized protein n=1 Tax=Vibrio vulnificus (strain YJ016) TaxID=196600 RepID=Q7MCC1_VIBVY|nr:hypothetical protein [Vibrio vulnificus YJ016]
MVKHGYLKGSECGKALKLTNLILVVVENGDFHSYFLHACNINKSNL